MKKALSVLVLSILCLSMFSILAPSLVKVSAGSPPEKVDNFSYYPSATYELLIWGNPLVNGFPDTSVTAFKIYKDGGLLTTVDWHTCRFRDYNPVNRWCQYGVSAVNAYGEGPQYTGWEWWGPGNPNVYYDLTLYCNPPEGGCITGMFTLRSGQTTAGKTYMPAMVNAVPAIGYNFTGQWTNTGSISVTYYFPQPICYIDNWWGNDATITAYFQKLPTHDVTIGAHCITEGADISVPITMDGASTGYNTPHVFSGLTSSHTFAVPANDPSGHPFIQWSTGETATTITVSGNGTYVAYYRSDTYDVTIAAHCYKEGVAVSVPIMLDGSPTFFNTPHVFTGLKGNHTFSVPMTDLGGHAFELWNTGQTTTAITVSVGSTYTAYYEHSYIRILDVKCRQDSVGFGKNVEVQISGENTGASPESRLVEVTMNGRPVEYASLYLPPGQTGSTQVIIPTKGLPSRDYAVTVSDDELRARGFEPPIMSVLGNPYFIIIAGGDESNGNYDSGLADDCNHAYCVLTEKVNVDKNRICYLAPQAQYDSKGNRITSNSSTSFSDVYWTLVEWAKDKTNSPLFIYLHGHGEVGRFGLNVGKDGSPTLTLSAEDIAMYLKLRTNGNKRPIYIIVDACHSGSFIENFHLDHNATAIVCSTKSDEDTLTTPDITLHEHGIFSQSFWTAIGEGKSIFDAYNKAGWDVRELVAKLLLIPNLLGKAETPVFDDIQSGNEFYGVSSVLGSKIPGPNGEGNCLSSISMGNCEWAYPWISSCSPTQYYAWPPPASIPIWAVIQNDTALSNVTILMLPPDLQPGNETLNLETYQMQDTKGNGNFSIQIPSVGFTDHASGPSIFSFFLVPRQEDGMSAYMREIDVVFTRDGQPAPDTVPPGVFITRPLSLDTVNGIIDINGTACDDVCLLKTELCIDGVLFQTLNLPASTTSLFQFQLDTSQLSNGCHNITVVAFDTSNNSANETLSVDAVNNVHDVAVVDVQPFKTCTAEGSQVNVTAVVANHGTYSENFNLSMYMNSTGIGSKVVTNLPAGGVTSVDFVWNTSGLPKGNYTITANVVSVPGETDTADNIYTYGMILVTIPGDVTGDIWVDMQDISIMVNKFMATPADLLRWDPNCDINNDLSIDMADISIAIDHFMQP